MLQKKSHNLAPADLSKIILGVPKCELYLNNKQDKVVEQVNFIFNFPTWCFLCLTH